MASNVVRQDVVQIGFEIENDPIKKLTKEINEIKKALVGVSNDDGFEDLKKEAKKSISPLEKVKKTAEDIKKKVTDIGKKAATAAYKGLKKVASVSFKALTVGIAGAAAAIGSLVTKSVQAYAEFEQLKGGVETLFKNSAGTVIKYANNAYKTAGLSANQYMETVTSFSASLLQSLDGDTKKAAKYADMAISDMADNANKMGTDMGSLQYAYQGFAKQNYTMLDNLKLGYGGTKSEMQRLVKEAASMKDVQKKLGVSVDANSLSYANIVAAIHVVQENMGILGTTQKEAEHTITGSLNAMKSSWQNLLTAMASGENIDQCIDNMISSVEIFMNNVMPVAEKALGGIGTLVEKVAPIIAEKLPPLAEKLLPPLIKAAVELTKGLIKALPEIIKSVATAIIDICGDQFPVLKGIASIIADNAQKIAKIIPVLIGLVAAFKLFKGIGSISSLIGGIFGGKSKGKADEKSGGMFEKITNTFKSLAKTKPTVILKGLANLGIIIGGLALIAAMLLAVAPKIAQLGDIKSLLKMVVVMGVVGVVGVALSKLSEIVGKIPVATVALGLANMAIMLAGMSALFLLVGAVSLINFDLKRILKITLILGVLGTVAAAISIFAGIAGLMPIATVLLGLANMALVVAGMSALYLLIGAVSLINFDLKRITQIVVIMGLLGTAAGSMTLFAGLVGMIPIPVVLAGLANMGLVLGGISALIVAFGKLSEVKGFTNFIEKGGAILEKIFNIIGKLVGSLIGGIGEGIANSLPKIAKSLSNFATALTPMFNLFKNADMDGIKEFFTALGGFIVKMTGNDILSFFTGGTDLAGLGTSLSDFAIKAEDFFIKVASYPKNGFSNASALFKSLADISNVPNTGGVAQWFSGENDYSSLARGLKQLSGEGVKGFYEMVSGIPKESFGKAADLFKSLSDIGNIPNTGGVTQWFTGENDFSGLAKKLPPFGESMASFYNSIKVIDEPKKISELFKALGDISKVPNEGGLWQGIKEFFGGDNALGKIGEELAAFGDKTKSFFKQVNNLNVKNLNELWDSLAKGKTVVVDVAVTFEDAMSDTIKYANDLPVKMGDAIKSSSDSLSNGLVEAWKEAVKDSINPVNKVLDAANWILKQFGSKQRTLEWKPYAKGTDGHTGGNALVNDGRGAELVQMPNGNSFIPQGRNVFIPNAPKGMKVLSAERTAKLLGRNSPTFRYASGIGDIDLWSFFDNVGGLVRKIVERISYRGMSDFPKNVGKGMVTTFTNAMPSWLDKLFEEGTKGLGDYNPSKGVSQWRSTVIRALKMEGQYSLANVARTLFQMQTESGGNPKAINLWDSNAKKGIPSKGLMQVIDPTFKAYAREGFNKNIYDPLSNILASVRYAVSRYGSLAKAYRGVGYSNGGLVTETGMIAEKNKPEMVIPLAADKRNHSVSLWKKTGNMLGVTSRSPESDSGYYESNTVESNTYAPQFTLNIEGSADERTLARKVKKWIKESLEETFSDLESQYPRIREF